MALYSYHDEKVETPGAGRCWVAPDASVIGRVRLEEDASIWFGAVIRGDNEPIVIGARSNVQDGCVLHVDPGFPLTIGADCTIGHLAMLHGCQIGKGSLIGIGAIILNGAVVGDECLIGAGTLIPEGRSIPPRSLVMGTPGRIVRQLSDEEARRTAQGAAHYVAKWRDYAAGLKPQRG